MQIQFKQPEIISALMQYIANQGIDLKGKQVTVAFNAGRKDNGISAEVEIQEDALPDFFDQESKQEAPKTILNLVTQPVNSPPTPSFADDSAAAEAGKLNSLFS